MFCANSFSLVVWQSTTKIVKIRKLSFLFINSVLSEDHWSDFFYYTHHIIYYNIHCVCDVIMHTKCLRTGKNCRTHWDPDRHKLSAINREKRWADEEGSLASTVKGWSKPQPESVQKNEKFQDSQFQWF
jgi:hypothetical protein